MRNFNLKLFTILILTSYIIGCATQTKKTEELYLSEAKVQLEDKKYDESIKTYREFLKEYPKSDKAIFVYNQIAGIQIDAMKNPLEGIKTYKELVEKFPNTKEAKQSIFMIAFIYDETLKDKDNAVKSYQEFLVKYPKDTDPNDKMSESAKTMLEVLQSGKSIEQMIQENIGKNSGISSDSGKVKVTQDPDTIYETKKNENKNVNPAPVDPKVPANKKEVSKPSGEDPAVNKDTKK